MRALLVLLLAAAAFADAPDARRVVVRGQTRLHDALLAAIAPCERVVLVVDVTPYTRDADKALFAALQMLDKSRRVKEWRIARLGEKASDPAPRAGALVGRFPEVFAQPVTARSTIRALRRTIKSLPQVPATVVYLADWRFEDDEALEAFIGTLERRRLRLSVVGSEAAYGRGWNDGFFPPQGRERYDPFIGRNAFETQPGVPWHGGDTAYNHLPFHYAMRWQTSFRAERRPTRRLKKFEDVRERIRAVRRDAAEVYYAPLPSSFGPYGLMRAAGITGGKYVLWSWNPGGRSNVRYDYARCNLFAPDLRDRNEIRKDARARPLARALVRAWHEVANDKVHVVRTTPPFDRSGTPAVMMETPGRFWISESFPTKAHHREFMKRAPLTIEAMDRARLLLAAAIHGAKDRRLVADAELFRHALAVQRFQLAEALAAAKTLPADAWRDKDLYPGLDPEVWIYGNPDGDRVQDVRLHDRDEAAYVLEERRRLVAAYRGTPVGATIQRNSVITYRIDWRKVGRGGPPPRGTAADSKQPKPPTTPPPTAPSAPSAPPTSGG